MAEMDPKRLFDVMGPGMYILFLGIALMTVGALHLIVNRSKGPGMKEMAVGKGMKGRAFGLIVAFIVYNILIDVLGYLASTFLFFLMQFRILGIKSWRMTCILSFVLATLYYVIFERFCNMVFPRGILPW